jgi:hypothetical protein
MAINVSDVADAVYSGLRELTGRRYLTAMWILGSELRDLYAAEVSQDRTALMTATLDVVRGVVMTGRATEFTDRAADLESAWDRICDELDDDPSATTGQSYTWGTFMSLTQEITGTVSSGDEAFEFLAGAVTERRDTEEQTPTWINDPDEQVAVTGAIGRTLTLFQRVVSEVARLPENGEDPSRVRDRIVGK